MSAKVFSHGRGGAGNIGPETVRYVDGINYSPPVLSVWCPTRIKLTFLQGATNPNYSTGRGGAGNIRKYNAQEVRIAQDVPTGPTHIPVATAAGRGGVGNLQAAKRRELERRQSQNSEARTSSDTTRTLSTVSSN